MTKKFLFLGSNGVGKTHLMLILAKILSKSGKEVLVLDDNNIGSYNYFNYNNDVEDEIAVTKEKTEIIRDNIEIKFGFENNKDIIEKYDYVFVEKNNEGINLKYFDKVFFMQNYDKEKLVRNKNIIKYYKDYDFVNTHFIFNQMLDVTMDKECLLNELVEEVKNKTQMINNEDFEIRFNEVDLMMSTINKFNGIIKLKNYSDDFKEQIFEIINVFEKFDNKEFKKIIEGRRF